MAKRKTTRKQYQARPRVAAQQAGIATTGGATATAAVAPAAAKPAADMRQEYQYVISDLKRIGLTAAAMFTVLIALALILT